MLRHILPFSLNAYFVKVYISLRLENWNIFLICEYYRLIFFNEEK